MGRGQSLLPLIPSLPHLVLYLLVSFTFSFSLSYSLHLFACFSISSHFTRIVPLPLAECNGSLPPGGRLIVTCGLTVCTPGSAPGPTLGNEYGKPLPGILCAVGAEVEAVGWAGDVALWVWTRPGVSAPGTWLRRSDPPCQCCWQRRHDRSSGRRCFQSRTEQRGIPLLLCTWKVSKVASKLSGTWLSRVSV